MTIQFWVMFLILKVVESGPKIIFFISYKGQNPFLILHPVFDINIDRRNSGVRDKVEIRSTSIFDLHI
jgi:hypothetical protein